MEVKRIVNVFRILSKQCLLVEMRLVPNNVSQNRISVEELNSKYELVSTVHSENLEVWQLKS